MSIVAGVDFGTLSVRVSIFDSVQGRLGAGAAEYPLLRKKEDPDHATQSQAEHMAALAAAVLCGITDPALVSRSICAMGHKWMWNSGLGGLPSEAFLTAVDPTLAGVRAQLGGRYATSNQIAGHLSEEWAARLGLRAGIPIPTGSFDAHWDAIGAGVRIGDVVNVVGTSTCIMAISDKP